MKRKSIFSLVVMAAVIGVLLFSASASVMAQDEEVTITVGTWADESFEAAVELFNDKYPNINVELQLAAIEDHHDNLLTRLAAGGEVPDVAYLEDQYISTLAARGGFVDLSQEPYNGDQHKDKLVGYPFAQATTQDGQLVAMPTDVAPGTIFYRHDRLEELGVDIEDIKTFEDWIEVGKKFTESGENRWLIGDVANIYTMMVNGSSTDRFFNENGELVINSPRFLKAFRTAKEVRDMGLDAEISEWTNEWFTVLREGQVLMQPSGAWLGGHLKEWIAPETAGKWRVTSFPEGYDGPWGGSFAGIPKSSDNKEAAWKFIEFMATDRAVQWSNFRIADMFPTIEDLYDHEAFAEEIDFYGGQKARLVWKETILNIPAINTNQHDSFVMDMMGNALGEVLEGNKTPEEALNETETLIERRIRR
ncbi:carbohydrate ABC transporter substrate-binding protein (CUT1 family) [Halanaerobium saccharolyticum]|uniref:Carbohydrate ABC transporter substrate-binding protein (CUT1 family) n=1 Tax=Halanaerobium saccharolyticum TaxID=43595 RepID=A0A4R6SIQ5_9FIRM|nr:extracellular solute-binding protein [Halanaerobium saccharolyticum]TDQ01724.1 carbohydrate ABC transporter substrate-binding protein (CUT1 family) [Halanaerobium saccharolyticum]